ncbi:response regulator transcription factor [Vibrio sp. HN007]|uniref:response regulator transcription factor n=1 Tax=Vibrio iocasae TaxID=3098914 RepID=UPI0035D4E41F
MNDDLIIDVLLVEDDKELASSVADYLKFENIRCDHAYNGHSGYNLAKDNHYDVILLDLMLPKIDGLTVCEKLRQSGADMPILMLTAKDTLEDKEAGFNAGTDDYLVKPFAMKELAMRVKALAKRRSSQSKKLTVADLVLDLERKSVTRGGNAVTLTRINLQLLELLMRSSPGVVSRMEIEEKLWPDETPESNNLKVQLYQLRQKIDKPFPNKLIETVVGQGFRIKG